MDSVPGHEGPLSSGETWAPTNCSILEEPGGPKAPTWGVDCSRIEETSARNKRQMPPLISAPTSFPKANPSRALRA